MQPPPPVKYSFCSSACNLIKNITLNWKEKPHKKNITIKLIRLKFVEELIKISYIYVCVCVCVCVDR